MEFLEWLENLGPIAWVRESTSLLGYTMYLAGHTLGLVFLLGQNLLIAAKLFGIVPELPLAPMREFTKFTYVGFWVTAICGTVLFLCAPVGYVQNIVFIIKMAAITVAVFVLRALLKELFSSPDPDARPVSARARTLNVLTMVLWTIAVVAGRLTAYSGVVVIASTGAFLVVSAIIAVIAYLFAGRRSEAFEVAGAAYREGK